MRAFILSTGRCGSTTFAQACRHISNYTSGHETLASKAGDARFDYADRHIEADNRLSWLLGDLAERFDPNDTLYVHLIRDPEKVAQSFLNRWDSAFPASIIRAFAQGILMSKGWSRAERLDVCRFYVSVVNRNIEQFTRQQPLAIRVRVESVEEDFPSFLDRIDARGDLTSAMAEWSIRHNPSVHPKGLRRRQIASNLRTYLKGGR